ncbi:unnamed protein product [Rotaria sordida]|uniref:ATP-dependent DNA helicase n=1 Tax=Rotaria sordida TaxID=392033 RepID=A0A813U070_9BILA|nr:unnamed protein product [Rotaria sordida]
MIKEWKRDIEARRDETRNYLILGQDTLEVRDDETQIEIVGTEIPTSPIKTKVATVPSVTATNAIVFPTKQDIVKQFTINTQQKYAFMIVTSHLDGEHYAYTEFPGCKFDDKLAELQSKIVPIAISEQTFLFDAKELLPENIAKAAKLNKKTTKLSVKRKALPLIPAYSMTTHKSQGQTLGKIIVDLVMPSGPLEVASVYVPLSRVKRLDDLLIIRPFEFATLQVKSSTAQIEELKRLDKIAQNTWKRFQFFV